MRTNDLFAWIKERHSIYTRRKAGQKKPWTEDEILLNYRFCNVYRELDKVTIWITNNWRKPYENDPGVWFAMMVSRLVNWPDTLAVIGYPSPWNRKAFVDGIKSRAGLGKAYGSAYIVSTNGRIMDKDSYLADHVCQPMWDQRDKLRPTNNDTLDSFHKRLMKCNGMGSFMAAQVVADVKYTPWLKNAKDWHTWAAPGPGSMRGLNRVMDRPIDATWPGMSWQNQLVELKTVIDALAEKEGMPPIHGQDLQNCLCEWDKYERTRLGQGKPRSGYLGRG
jgi:hypothetical protein